MREDVARAEYMRGYEDGRADVLSTYKRALVDAVIEDAGWTP